MVGELRDSYSNISTDYLEKKNQPWKAFIQYFEQNSLPSNFKENVSIDIGTGNGRNLIVSNAILKIGLDLSFELLLGYVGPKDCQRIAGSLPHLPFRNKCSDLVLFIAVLHHLNSENARLESLKDIKRITKKNSNIYVSVWRKWRLGIKESLFTKLKNKESINDLINIYHPWHDSSGNVIGKRFYHYFTFKELYQLCSFTNLSINNYERIGGKNNDDNIFAILKHKY